MNFGTITSEAARKRSPVVFLANSLCNGPDPTIIRTARRHVTQEQYQTKLVELARDPSDELRADLFGHRLRGWMHALAEAGVTARDLYAGAIEHLRSQDREDRSMLRGMISTLRKSGSLTIYATTDDSISAQTIGKYFGVDGVVSNEAVFIGDRTRREGLQGTFFDRSAVFSGFKDPMYSSIDLIRGVNSFLYNISMNSKVDLDKIPLFKDCIVVVGMKEDLQLGWIVATSISPIATPYVRLLGYS